MCQYEKFKANVNEPLSVAMNEVHLKLGGPHRRFWRVVAQTAVLLVFQMGQPRILFAMSRDRLLPKAMAKTHSRFRTPHVATLLTGLFVAVGSAVASLEETADLCNIGTLSAFIIVCAGVIVLRWRASTAVSAGGSTCMPRGRSARQPRRAAKSAVAARHRARPASARLRAVARPRRKPRFSHATGPALSAPGGCLLSLAFVRAANRGMGPLYRVANHRIGVLLDLRIVYSPRPAGRKRPQTDFHGRNAASRMTTYIPRIHSFRSEATARTSYGH